MPEVLSSTARQVRQRPERATASVGSILTAAWPITAVFVLSNAATPLYVLWQRSMGFSKGTLTVIFAFYIVGLLASLLVSGIASDRLGRKAVLIPALLLALAACLVFATATSVVALIVARLFTGIAVGAVVSAGMAAVSDVAGPERRRQGALLASCAMVFGAGLGPLAAGILAQTVAGPTVTVFAVEAVLLLTALVAVLRLPLPKPARAAHTAPAARAAGTGGTAGGSWIRIPSVPPHGRVPLLHGIAAFAPGITATSFVLSLGPSLLANLLHSGSRILAGCTAFVMFAAATGAQFAVHRLSRRRILLVSLGATTLAMAALAGAVTAGSAPLLFTAAILAGVGQGLGQLAGLSLLNATIPARRLAEANAALNVGGYLAAGTLPVAAGYLSDAVGLSTSASVFAAVLAALAIGGAAVVVATRHRVEEPA
ncbi:MFS transporter [Catenulispora rubra]|uniref:MFS transporter n=1 Tax=Catenulispora rubra TaxID=280293 RepID=UPI0018926FBF|nr:MFS transporter [Catenulispora rubra]